MSPAAKARVIALATLALLLLIFVVQNTEVVAVHFLLWSLHMSQVVLIGITAALGFGCGLLAAHLLRRPPERPPAGGSRGRQS